LGFCIFDLFLLGVFLFALFCFFLQTFQFLVLREQIAQSAFSAE
jgi:hypothetical protein